MSITLTGAALILSACLLLRLAIRFVNSPLRVLTLLGLGWFFGPQLSEAAAPLLAEQSPLARLEAMQRIAAEPVAVDEESCSDEDFSTCYQQRNRQHADQMSRLLALMEG